MRHCNSMLLHALQVLALVGPLGCSAGPEGRSEAHHMELYVSPKGSDLHPGTQDQPLASLEAARDMIREMRLMGTLPPGGATIWLREGVYFRSGSFILSPQDSGTANSPLRIAGFPGETARIQGGLEAPSAHPETDSSILDRFSAPARQNVRVSNVKALGPLDLSELTKYFATTGTDILPAGMEVFMSDQPLQLARWPNSGWAKVAGLPTGSFSGLIAYEDDNPSRWTRCEDIYLYGYWAYDWFANYEKVRSIDPVSRTIQTAYIPPPDPYGFRVGQRYMAINVLEELDEPGEWYLDRISGDLHFWPPEGLFSAPTVVSLCRDPLIRLDHTSHVTLDNLTLEETRGCGVEIQGGHHNIVKACRLQNIGTIGVAIGGMFADIQHQLYFNTPFSGDGGQYNGVDGCEILGTGMGGVLLGGGDRMTLEPGFNFVTNTIIHHFSRRARTGRPAILLYGVGNTVGNNLIHDGPDLAIAFWGNDHVIEFNEIHHVGLDVDDGGALYLGRDYSQRGSIIRFNHFHDLTGANTGGHIGVYLDDMASGTTIYGNIFQASNFAVNIGGGRENHIENNIFFDCLTSVRIDARGTTWLRSYFDGTDNTLWNRLDAVHFMSSPYALKYPGLAALPTDEPALPKGNELRRNIFVKSPGPLMLEGTETLVLREGNLEAVDPGFFSLAPPDFHLRPDSPAWSLGFKPIPVERIGPFNGSRNLAD